MIPLNSAFEYVKGIFDAAELTNTFSSVHSILNQTMNAPCFFLIRVFIFATFYRNLTHSFMASVFKFQTDFCHDFVAQRFISSRTQPNGIFANARESRVVWLWKKIVLHYCIDKRSF